MKQHYCFLERFNNYFNRKIIKYETLLDYQNNSKDFFIPEDSQGNMLPFDFNPNDNVTTEIIANDLTFDPDYFLLLDNEQNIVSRWFVLEQKRNRQGQWLYTLRRDVVSDNLDTLENAPIFVEKGMLNEDDPFIVNSEGMSLNQIKRSEIQLRDRSNTAWLIGYIAKSKGGDNIPVQANNEDVETTTLTLENISEDVGLPASTLASLINLDGERTTPMYVSTSFRMLFNLQIQTSSSKSTYEVNLNDSITIGNGNFLSTSSGITNCLGRELKTTTQPNIYLNAFILATVFNRASLLNQLPSILGRSYLINTFGLEKLKTYNDKTVYYRGKYYKFNVIEQGTHSTASTNINGNSYSSLTSISTDFKNRIPDEIVITDNIYARIQSNEKTIYCCLTYISDGDSIAQLDLTISSGRKTTYDQEFDIIALPLNIEVFGDDIFNVKEETQRRIASAIGIQLGKELYDLQLLPYCPLPELKYSGDAIDIRDLTEHKDFDLVTQNRSREVSINASLIAPVSIRWQYVDNGDHDTWTYTLDITELAGVPAGAIANILNVSYDVGSPKIRNFSISSTGSVITMSFDNYEREFSGQLPDETFYIYFYFTPATSPVGIMFYVQKSTFSLNIEKEIKKDLSKKIISNCFNWRIISPNYQGAFDFNIAKNGGSVESFNVYCTYKPFTPLIKVSPNFNWLYGLEFGDNRGLICAGDFSLPRITDEWQNYELNNKNYQNIFNRDIQHLDFMQSIEMRNQLVSGAVGILSDTAKGAGAGAYLGGPAGAVVGGLVSGATSGIGYAIDVDTLARTQRENKQLAIDKFNYQLGNIKALPYTLTKVGSFNAISKIYPIIEEYSCSDKELEAFENKIKYESMTVMRIGTLSEFMNFNGELNYFKGQLIRNDEIADDPHILNAIYEELLKGVYI